MTGIVTPAKPALIFDLDGTLIDSATAIRDVANRLLAEAGLAPLSIEETRSFIGSGAAVFVSRALTARGSYDDERFPAMLQRFHEHYADAPGAANPPYRGAEASLRALIDEGYALGLCTNKPHAPTQNVLAALGWQPLFGAVVAGDTLPVRKPDPAPLREAARRLEAAAVIYIGDSEVDAQTAAAAGVPFVLYRDGYRKGPVEAMVHHAAFDDHDALPIVIAQVVRGLGGG